MLLALGLMVVPVHAEEVQWRSSTNQGVPAGSSAGAASGSQPSGSPADKSPPSETTRSVSLRRPVPLQAPAASPPTSEIAPVTFQGVPLARGKAEDDVRSPLPSGPSLKPDQEKPDQKKPDQEKPDQEKPDQEKSDQKKPGKIENIPVEPNVLPGQPGAGIIISDDCLLSDGQGCCDSCCCDPGCGDCFNDCCRYRGNCFWFSAEYLLWRFKHENAPPLLTTSNGPPNPGILGRPDTSVLVNDQNLPNDTRSGARFTLGFWFPRFDCLGMEVSYFFIGQQSRSANFSSPNGEPVLGRPFTDVLNNNVQGAFLTGGPVGTYGFIVPGINGANGTFNMTSTSYLWGLEANLRQKLCCGPCGYLDLLFGYRHLQLTDSINITDVENSVAGPGAGTSVVSHDSFATRNQFNGGQIGLDGCWYFWRRCFVGGTVKVAFGDVRQTVTISGDSTITGSPNPAANGSFPAGVLALPSNIGEFHRDRFAVLPEATLKVGCDLTQHLRFWVGYNVIYLSDAVRAGSQIDLNLNKTLLPGNGPVVGPPRPAVLFKASDFWAQGVNFGLEYRY
jgi:hypothetical protein